MNTRYLIVKVLDDKGAECDIDELTGTGRQQVIFQCRELIEQCEVAADREEDAEEAEGA